MGNIIAIQLDINLFKDPQPSSFPWAIVILSLTILLTIALICFITLRFIIRRKPVITAPVITCLLLVLLFTPIESRAKGKFHVTRLKKPIARGIGSLLGTTAVYFGLDSLATALEKDPEIAVPILAIIGCLTLFLILLLIQVVLSIYKYLKPNPRLLTSPPIELTEITSAVQELVNRSDPPNRN